MAFVPALNTAQVVISYISEYGEEAKNVLHFRHVPGAITELAMDELKGNIYTWLSTHWDAVAADSWQTDLIVIRDLTIQDGMIKQYVETVTGTNLNAELPAQNTVAISWRTGFAGGSRRGRTYHVGLRKSGVVGSSLTSGESAALVTAYNAMLTVFLASDWEFVVASFRTAAGPRATALLTPITHCIITDVVVDSMDSRKPRDRE